MTYLLQIGENTIHKIFVDISLGTTLSYSNLVMILVHRLSQVIQNTHTGKPLVGISPNWNELMFSEIHPGSMSHSNITEKNLM